MLLGLCKLLARANSGVIICTVVLVKKVNGVPERVLLALQAAASLAPEPAAVLITY